MNARFIATGQICTCQLAFFLSLHADPYGGAILCDSQETTLKIDESIFIDNSAKIRGGSIAVDHVKLAVISKSCFLQCISNYGHGLSMNLEMQDHSNRFRLEQFSDAVGNGWHCIVLGAHEESSVNSYNSSNYKGNTDAFTIHFSQGQIECRNIIIAESVSSSTFCSNQNMIIKFKNLCNIHSCSNCIFHLDFTQKEIYVFDSIFIFAPSFSLSGISAFGNIEGVSFDNCVSNVNTGPDSFIFHNPLVTSYIARVLICKIRESKTISYRSNLEKISIMGILLFPQ